MNGNTLTEGTYVIRGFSMRPMFDRGMHLMIERCEKSSCRTGDIIVRGNGDSMIMHRVTHIKMNGGELIIYTKGDSCLRFDPAMGEEERIRGRAIGFRDGGIFIDLLSAGERRFARLIAFYSRCTGNIVLLVDLIFYYLFGIKGRKHFARTFALKVYKMLKLLFQAGLKMFIAVHRWETRLRTAR